MGAAAVVDYAVIDVLNHSNQLPSSQIAPACRPQLHLSENRHLSSPTSPRLLANVHRFQWLHTLKTNLVRSPW